MRYVVSVGYLGYTRCNNVCAYNPESRGFDDLTPAEARRLIDCGQIKGLLWRNGEEGPEFYPDVKGFNQVDVMVKSANKFRPMVNDVVGAPVNSFFTTVRVLDTDYKGRLYEVVSNKYSRVKFTEESLRKMAEITVISGVWITDDEIKIADGVMYEDRRAGALFKKGLFKDNQPIPEDPLAAIDLSLLEKKEPEELEEETLESNENDVPAGQETLESLFGNSGTDFAEDANTEEFKEEVEEKPAKNSKKSSKKKK